MGLRGLIDRFLARKGGVTPGPSKLYPWVRLLQERTAEIITEAEAREIVVLRHQVLLAEQRADEAQRLAGMKDPHVIQNTPPIMVGGKSIAWQKNDGALILFIATLEIDEYGEPYLVDVGEEEVDENG
jgi:hypothetical protein